MGEMPVSSPINSKQKSKRLSGIRFDERPLRVRIMIVGDESVGKSCIIKRYCEKRFVSKYLPTIGIDYGATKIYVDKKQVSVHIFDTSGQNIFQEVRNEFYRDAHGILFVMDVGRRDSFDYLNRLINEIRTELYSEGKGFENVIFFLAANKCDIDGDRREVDELEAQVWAELYGFPYYSTSAANGSGITEMFQAFFSQIVKHVESTKGSAHKQKRQIPVVRRSRERSSSIQLPAPSHEQLSIMTRLSENIDPWLQMGISKQAKSEEVNRTYRRLAVLLHPDKTQATGTAEAFMLLGKARNQILKSISS